MGRDSIDIKHIMCVFHYDTQYRGCTRGAKSTKNHRFSPFSGIFSLFDTPYTPPILSIIKKCTHNMLYINGIPYHMNNLGLKSVFKWENHIFHIFLHFPIYLPLKCIGTEKWWGGGGGGGQKKIFLV